MNEAEILISVGETAQDTEQVEKQQKINKLIDELQDKNATFFEWITAEYLKDDNLNNIEYYFKLLNIDINNLTKVTITNFYQDERSPIHSFFENLKLIKNLLEKPTRDNRDSLSIVHSEFFNGTDYIVIACEGSIKNPEDSSIEQLKKQIKLLSVKNKDTISITQDHRKMMHIYIPEVAGCDQVAFYVDRNEAEPIVENNRIRTQYFDAGNMGNKVHTYTGKDKEGKDIVMYTGMDSAGAKTFEDKAHYFAARILLQSPDIRERIYSFPIDLFKRDFLNIETSNDQIFDIKIIEESSVESPMTIPLSKDELDELKYICNQLKSDSLKRKLIKKAGDSRIDDSNIKLNRYEDNKVNYVAGIKKYYDLEILNIDHVTSLLKNLMLSLEEDSGVHLYQVHRATIISTIKNHFPSLNL